MGDQTTNTATDVALSPNLIKLLVRTFMPFVYSSVAAIIAHFGYHVSLATVIQIVGGGFIGVTIVLHWLETKYPWVGALLGWIGAPQYAPSAKVVLAAQSSVQATEITALNAQITALQNVITLKGTP